MVLCGALWYPVVHCGPVAHRVGQPKPQTRQDLFFICAVEVYTRKPGSPEAQSQLSNLGTITVVLWASVMPLLS